MDEDFESVAKALESGADEPLSGYLLVNEYTNAFDYLKKTELFLKASDDPFRWKWAAISLSSALYGFMVCALNRGNHRNVRDQSKLKKSIRIELRDLAERGDAEAYAERNRILQELQSKRRIPLIGFDDALKRVQNEAYIIQYTMSRAVSLTESENKNILTLRWELRNKFEHFTPTVWAIEEAYFHQPLQDTCKAISEVLSCGNLFHYNSSMRESGKTLEDARAVVCRLREMLREAQENSGTVVPGKLP